MNYIISLFVSVILSTAAFSQQAIKFEYDNYLKGNGIGSTKSILQKAKDGSSRYFIILSFYVDANNSMYKKSKDLKYLKNIDILYKELSKKDNFVAKFYSNENNSELNNKESILLEGYLWRYFAEYFYILSKIEKNQLTINSITDDYSFLSNRINYWISKSEIQTLDDSFFQGIRVHMGAQWGSCFLYMSKLKNSNSDQQKYLSILGRFNENLRKNLKKRNVNGNLYYEWNSTWDNLFTKTLIKRNRIFREGSQIQDTSHGNHIVSYIISCYEEGYGGWGKPDINMLISTLKTKIYNRKNNTFFDLINGKNSTLEEIKGTGVKQSDGWMKLLIFDEALKSIYANYWSYNNSSLVKTNYYNQFLANLY